MTGCGVVIAGGNAELMGILPFVKSGINFSFNGRKLRFGWGRDRKKRD